jgi:hypothetical protein
MKDFKSLNIDWFNFSTLDSYSIRLKISLVGSLLILVLLSEFLDYF